MTNVIITHKRQTKGTKGFVQKDHNYLHQEVTQLYEPEVVLNVLCIQKTYENAICPGGVRSVQPSKD